MRRLTDSEMFTARLWFPNLALDRVVVTGEADTRYNCVAWSLGIDDFFIWPWGLRLANKGEFNVLYRNYGYVPVGVAPQVASFGFSPWTMTHSAVWDVVQGLSWESKCGAWLRITHTLQGLEHGPLYGDIQGFYTDHPYVRVLARAMVTDRVRSARAGVEVRPDEAAFVRRRATAMPAGVREYSEAAYARWKQDWSRPAMLASSAPWARAYSPAFLELLALGTAVVPLLLEKLLDPDDFFALVALELLLPPALVASWTPDDERMLLGEQGRAQATIRRWTEVYG